MDPPLFLSGFVTVDFTDAEETDAEAEAGAGLGWETAGEATEAAAAEAAAAVLNNSLCSAFSAFFAALCPLGFAFFASICALVSNLDDAGCLCSGCNSINPECLNGQNRLLHIGFLRVGVHSHG